MSFEDNNFGPSCVCDDGVLESNGGIKRKSKLRRMNHLHPTCL